MNWPAVYPPTAAIRGPRRIGDPDPRLSIFFQQGFSQACILPADAFLYLGL
jgi:hypothetical protein